MKKPYENPELDLIRFSFENLLEEQMSGSKQEGQGEQLDF